MEETTPENTESKEFRWYDRWQKRLESWKALIILVSSIGALIMATFSSMTARENQAAISDLADKINVADSIASTFRIAFPQAGDTVDAGNFTVTGTWLGEMNIIQQNSILVFVRWRNLYFPALTKASVAASKKWSAEMYLDGKDKVTLVVALADPDDSDWYHTWVRETDGRGLNGLPSDLIVLDEVQFSMRPQGE